MAKSPAAKKTAPKKPIAGARKAAGGKKPVSKRKTAPPKKAEAARKKAPPRKSGGRRKDAPNWLAGQLVLQSGVIGLQTAQGFISLQQVADAGELARLDFPLRSSGSAELYAIIGKLAEFLQAHAQGTILGNVTCCFPPH